MNPSIKSKQNTKERRSGEIAKLMPMLKKKGKGRPKPKVPHLALPPELDCEDRHAIHLRLSGSHPSYLYWIW